jgi:hypothetical protein
MWCDICLRGEAAIQGFIQNPELHKTEHSPSCCQVERDNGQAQMESTRSG